MIKKLILLLLLQSLWAGLATPKIVAQDKPNIVYILADDMGWMDPGYNGNTFYETPNIDQLAADGMVFNRAYTGGPNCLPTRACIMSGMYCTRTNIWTPGGLSKGSFQYMKLLVPNKKNNKGKTFESSTKLKADVVSLAEILKPAGYTTARFGKWHLGQDTQGFELSGSAGAKNYRNEGMGYGDIKNSIKITDAAVDFIDDNRERPFFLYLSHFEVHSPLKAEQEVIKKYQDKLESKSWKKNWNPTYAAMVEALDNSVGRVTKKLDELGLSDNTLVIFGSDNGGVGRFTPLKPLKGAKGSFYEGGIRVSTCMKWPTVIKAGSTCDTPITSVDWMPTFAKLTGAKLPTDQPVDGASIVPLLTGEAIPERSIFWHYPLYLKATSEQGREIPVAGTNKKYWRAAPSSLICNGDWKLIHYLEEDRVELYNVAEDVSESNNLADSNPDKAAQLLTELNRWRQETKAPIPKALNSKFSTLNLK